MKTLLDLLAAFSELAKINKAQKAQLEGAFSSLDEGSKSEAITKAVNETLAKFSEDETPTPAPATPAAGESAPEDKKVEATDKGTGDVTVSASELATLRASAAKLAEMTKTSVVSFSEAKFSELATKGNVLPKHKAKVLAFSETLDLEKAKSFFEVLGEMKAFNTTEVGTGQAPAPTADKDAKFAEAKEFMINTLGFSEEDATKAATKAMEETK